MTPDGPPDMSPGALTTVTITTGRPAALVAFHDGPRFDADWQPATMKSTTRFEAQVRGPYVVSIVCENMFTSPAGTFASWDTLQIGRTLDDPHDITACKLPAATHVIAGHMVQAGSVVAGGSTATSATASWDFKLSVPDGTYDVIATTNEGVLVKRDLAVTTDLTLAEPIDVAQNGTPLVTTSFSITNATVSESLRATAFLETGTSSLAALLYNGPPTMATVIPDAGLRATDNQTVSLRAFTTISDGILLRAVRRPFRVGGDTRYTLPAPLVNPQWTFELQGSGVMGVSLTWTQLSLIGNFTEEFTGTTSDGTDASYELDLTEKFVTATSTASMRIDTDIAGYKPEWRIDPKKTFTLQLIAEHIADGVTTSLSLSETSTFP